MKLSIQNPSQKQNEHHFYRPRNLCREFTLAFGAIILLGTFALALPSSSQNGVSCGWMTALFTAVSATCVTGLSLVDTYTQWSLTGQWILLILMETGGLGIMSLVTLLFFLLRKQMDFGKMMLLAQSLGSEDYRSLIRIQKRLLAGSILFQVSGAIALALRFQLHYGWKNSLWLGVFHSVSAFCNAGFDLFGFLKPGAGYTLFQQDPVVCIITALLIIIGGLGFIVWNDVLDWIRGGKCTVYTKLVLCVTLGLLTTGTIGFFLLERHNPATLGNMPLWQQWLNAFFQSVTTRTAGFATLQQGDMTEMGQLLTMVLMLIGGSSGSTAGGLKTVSFFLVLLFIWNTIHNRQNFTVFHRNIPLNALHNALALSGYMTILILLGTCVLCCADNISMSVALFEVMSALSTVGLSTGVTALLGTISQSVLIALMFLGRIGILTFSMSLHQKETKTCNYTYPDAILLIG